MDWQILIMLISWGVAVTFIGLDWVMAFWIIISINVVGTCFLAVKLLNNKRSL